MLDLRMFILSTFRIEILMIRFLGQWEDSAAGARIPTAGCG